MVSSFGANRPAGLVSLVVLVQGVTAVPLKPTSASRGQRGGPPTDMGRRRAATAPPSSPPLE